MPPPYDRRPAPGGSQRLPSRHSSARPRTTTKRTIGLPRTAQQSRRGHRTGGRGKRQAGREETPRSESVRFGGRLRRQSRRRRRDSARRRSAQVSTGAGVAHHRNGVPGRRPDEALVDPPVPQPCAPEPVGFRAVAARERTTLRIAGRPTFRRLDVEGRLRRPVPNLQRHRHRPAGRELGVSWA